MSKSTAGRRVGWAIAAMFTFSLLILLAFQIRMTPEEPTALRPVGSISDIASLAARDDLNVLFILVDTLRADRLGCYGYERDTSPTLDRLASLGIRFERHLAQSSWTKCSMASLWTGMNPNRNGITRFDDVLPDDAIMPAEILRENGFQTIGIYRNGWVAPTFGFDQGFDVYQRPVASPKPAKLKRENPTMTDHGTDDDVIETAIEFLRVNGRERWFLYLHLMDLHEYLYDETSALFGSNYSDIYDNSIRWTDRTLDLLLGSLAVDGYLDNTLIVITSDHGEAFQERGYEGHARKVFKETTEVPLIVSLPFRLDPGLVVQARSRGIDVWPTIFDLIGIDLDSEVDGRSLMPDILASGGQSRPPTDRSMDEDEEPIFGIAHLDQHWGQRGHEPRPTVAVTEGPYRYVRIEVLGDRVIEQLFDASVDPPELQDVASADAETLARLRAKADAYMEQLPEWGKAPTKELNELELNQLRALGYAIP